jgi:hypothetical protein
MIHFLRKLFKKESWNDHDVVPQCILGTRKQFLGCDYILYPCCFTRVGKGQDEFKHFFNGDLSDFDIRKKDHLDIFKSKSWRKFVKGLKRDPLPICRLQCHKKFAPRKNFDGRNGYNYF